MELDSEPKNCNKSEREKKKKAFKAEFELPKELS